MKRNYVRPQILQTASMVTEKAFLFGSIVDYIFPVETIGAEVDHRYDFSTDDTFNHRWED